MSIYPVRIKKFFPPVLKSESKEAKVDNKIHRQTIRLFLEHLKCKTCGNKVKMRNGWVFHSMPWGHICDEAWCSERCLRK